MAPSKEDLSLDYIGRVHANLLETGKAVNRSQVSETVLAILLILLALDVIRSGSQYDAAGVQIELQAPILLVAGVVVLAAIFCFHIGLVAHEAALLGICVRIYRDLGFHDRSLDNLLASPLETPSVFTTIANVYQLVPSPRWIGKIAYRAVEVFGIGLFLGLPLLAQVVVVWYLVVSEANVVLLIVAIFSSLVTITHLYVYSRRAGSFFDAA